MWDQLRGDIRNNGGDGGGASSTSSSAIVTWKIVHVLVYTIIMQCSF